MSYQLIPTVAAKLRALFGTEGKTVVTALPDALPEELPAITDSDEGKVLSVDHTGGLVLVDPTEVFKVTILSGSGTSGDPYTSTLTPQQILDYMDAGVPVIPIWRSGNMLRTGMIDICNQEEGTTPEIVMVNFFDRGGTTSAHDVLTLKRFYGNIETGEWSCMVTTVVSG